MAKASLTYRSDTTKVTYDRLNRGNGQYVYHYDAVGRPCWKHRSLHEIELKKKLIITNPLLARFNIKKSIVLAIDELMKQGHQVFIWTGTALEEINDVHELDYKCSQIDPITKSSLEDYLVLNRIVPSEVHIFDYFSWNEYFNDDYESTVNLDDFYQLFDTMTEEKLAHYRRHFDLPETFVIKLSDTAQMLPIPLIESLFLERAKKIEGFIFTLEGYDNSAPFIGMEIFFTQELMKKISSFRLSGNFDGVMCILNLMDRYQVSQNANQLKYFSCTLNGFIHQGEEYQQKIERILNVPSLESIQLKDVTINLLPILQNQQIRTIDLIDCLVLDEQEVNQCQQSFSHLKELHLKKTIDELTALHLIKNSSSLEKISFSELFRVKEHLLEHLPLNLSQLTEFEIEDSSTRFLWSILEHASNLQKLIINYPSIEDEDSASEEESQEEEENRALFNFTHLADKKIKADKIKIISTNALSLSNFNSVATVLNTFPYLEQLLVLPTDDTNIDREDNSIYIEVQPHTHLKVLDLSTTNISSRGLVTLFSKLPVIESIILRDCYYLDSSAASDIEENAHFISPLKRLVLGAEYNDSIDTAASTVLFLLNHAPAIESLFLGIQFTSDNALSDCSQYLPLRSQQNLHELKLRTVSVNLPEHERIWCELFQSMPHVKRLQVDIDGSYVCEQNTIHPFIKQIPEAFKSLQELKINTHFNVLELKKLLASLTNLHSLEIKPQMLLGSIELADIVHTADYLPNLNYFKLNIPAPVINNNSYEITLFILACAHKAHTIEFDFVGTQEIQSDLLERCLPHIKMEAQVFRGKQTHLFANCLHRMFPKLSSLNVDHIRIQPQPFYTTPSLRRLDHLRHLNMRGNWVAENGFSDDDDLLFFYIQCAPNLETIDASMPLYLSKKHLDNCITVVENRTLLRCLSLDFNGDFIDFSSMVAFINTAPNLKNIHFMNMEVRQNKAPVNHYSTAQLEKIKLSNCTNFNINIFCNTAFSSPSLKHLTLINCDIEDMGTDEIIDFSLLERLSNLKMLAIVNCHGATEEFTKLLLKYLPQLEVLILSNSEEATWVASRLASSHFLPYLRQFFCPDLTHIPVQVMEQRHLKVFHHVAQEHQDESPNKYQLDNHLTPNKNQVHNLEYVFWGARELPPSFNRVNILGDLDENNHYSFLQESADELEELQVAPLSQEEITQFKEKPSHKSYLYDRVTFIDTKPSVLMVSSANDIILKFRCDVPVKIAYSTKTSTYYIWTTEQRAVKASLSYLFQRYFLNHSIEDAIPLFQEVFTEEHPEFDLLRFPRFFKKLNEDRELSNHLSFIPYNTFKDVKSFIRSTRNPILFNRILAHLTESFYEFSQEKAEQINIDLTFESYLKAAQDMLEHEIGSCRHRAHLFAELVRYLGGDAQVVRSKIHRWPEVRSEYFSHCGLYYAPDTMTLKEAIFHLHNILGSKGTSLPPCAFLIHSEDNQQETVYYYDVDNLQLTSLSLPCSIDYFLNSLHLKRPDWERSYEDPYAYDEFLSTGVFCLMEKITSPQHRAFFKQALGFLPSKIVHLVHNVGGYKTQEKRIDLTKETDNEQEIPLMHLKAAENKRVADEQQHAALMQGVEITPIQNAQPADDWNIHDTSQLLTLESYFADLIQIFADPNIKEKNGLIKFDSQELQTAFYYSFVNYLSQRHIETFHIDSLEMINESYYGGKTDSENNFTVDTGILYDFLNTKSKTIKVLFISWAGFSSNQIAAYKSVMDKYRRLEECSLHAHVVVIGMITHEAMHVLGLREDFIERLTLISTMPFNHAQISPPNFSQYIELIAEEANRSNMLGDTDDVDMDEGTVDKNSRECSEELIHRIDLGYSVNWRELLLGRVVRKKQASHYIPSALSSFLSMPLPFNSAPRKVILSSISPDNKSFELWFNELQIKRGFYAMNKQWITIPEGWQVVMEQKPIPLIIKDFTYSVFPCSTINDARFDFVLSPDNFNDYFFSINHLNNNNEMESLPGLLQNPQQFGVDGKRLRLLVTEPLEYDAQWLQLFASAHEKGIDLEFIVLPHVVMPTWFKSAVNLKQASHSNNINEAAFIVCDNATRTLGKLVALYPAALATCVNSETEPYALWSKFNKDERGEVFIDNSDVLQWLLEGKIVIVHAEEFHPQLISRIATLLLPKPYALINSQKVPVTGKLILVSPHEIDLPYVSTYYDCANVCLETSAPSVRMVERTPLFSSEDPEIGYQQLIQSRCQDVHNLVTQNTCLAITGGIATGKTLLMLCSFVKQYPQAHLFNGIDLLEEWAKDEREELKILFIDDLHLVSGESRCHLFSQLAGLFFIKPGILLNSGRHYPLDAYHKVVVASTLKEYPVHSFLETHVAQYNLRPLPLFFLHQELKYISDELIKEQNNGSMMQLLMQQALNKAMVELLNEFETTQKAAVPWTIRQLQEQFLERALNVIDLSDRPEHASLCPYAYVDDFILTKSNAPLFEQMELIHKKFVLKQNNPRLKNTGLTGLLIEGPAGCGKSEACSAFLKKHGYQEATSINLDNQSATNKYYHITSGDIANLEVLWMNIISEKQPIAIWYDEMNALKIYEFWKKIFTLMDTSQDTPPIMIIATQNSIALSGRSVIPEDIENRFEKIVVGHLSAEEKVELGAIKYPELHECLTKLAQQHLSTRSYLKVCAKKAMELNLIEQKEAQQPPSKKYKENNGEAQVRGSESPSTMFYYQTPNTQDRERRAPTRSYR